VFTEVRRNLNKVENAKANAGYYHRGEREKYLSGAIVEPVEFL